MIVIVCGIPGSGKTTLATAVQRRLAERGYAFELRHSDDYNRRTYDRLYADVASGIEAQSELDARGKRGEPDGRDEPDGRAEHVPSWILDGTFYRREWRNRFYRLDDTYEVWVRASLETCLARNRSREDTIPERGLRSIRSQFEPPRAALEIDTEALALETGLARFENAVLGWVDDDDAVS